MSKIKSIKIKENIIWRKIAERTVILNRKNDSRYILNEIGMIIWNCIADGKSVYDTIDAISKEYSIPRERISCDVDHFIQNLQKENIISVKESGYHRA